MPGREEGWAVEAQEVDEGNNGRGREGGRQYGKESSGMGRAKGQRMGGFGWRLQQLWLADKADVLTDK